MLVTRGFIDAIKNSILVTASTIVVSLAIATPAAYAFTRLQLPRP